MNAQNAQQQLRERIAVLSEADVVATAGLIDDALPPEFRAVVPARVEAQLCSREQLLNEIDALTETEACEVLEYLDWITSDAPEELSAEELEDVRRGQEEIARGEYVTLEELRQHLGL